MDDLYYSIDVPYLNIGSRVGYTDYIDFLTWNEVTSPVMKGTDVYGRNFIVLKMIINDKKIMQTFFKRYSRGTCWMGCGHATTNLISTYGGMNEEQAHFLRELIQQGENIIDIDINPEFESFIGNKVYIYDENRQRAAIIIQRAWRKCRYEPRYEMCSRVQMNNLNEICNNYF
jgi:hypothetical protein